MSNIETEKVINTEGRLDGCFCTNGSGHLKDLPKPVLAGLVSGTRGCYELETGKPFFTTKKRFLQTAAGFNNKGVDEVGLRKVMEVGGTEDGLLEVRLVDLVRGVKNMKTGEESFEVLQAVTDGSRVIFSGAHGNSLPKLT